MRETRAARAVAVTRRALGFLGISTLIAWLHVLQSGLVSSRERLIAFREYGRIGPLLKTRYRSPDPSISQSSIVRTAFASSSPRPLTRNPCRYEIEVNNNVGTRAHLILRIRYIKRGGIAAADTFSRHAPRGFSTTRLDLTQPS